MQQVKRRRWTQEEINYLSESWGMFSVTQIAKNLGRTEKAVIEKAYKLKLGGWYSSGDFVTVNQVVNAVLGHDLCSTTRRAWIENRGLPFKYRTKCADKIRVIKIDDFWKWAYENQQFLDFSNFEENALGKEPEWVKVKRQTDCKRTLRIKQTWWTAYEDEQLRSLLREYKYTISQIAVKLQRTEGGVRDRIYKLGLMERPIREDDTIWTDEEISSIERMILQGLRYEDMHEAMPDKSTTSMHGMLYRKYNTSVLCKIRRIIKEQEVKDAG